MEKEANQDTPTTPTGAITTTGFLDSSMMKKVNAHRSLFHLVEACIRAKVFERPVAQIVMEMEHDITSRILDEQQQGNAQGQIIGIENGIVIRQRNPNGI